MNLELTPITLREARAYVEMHHRHHDAPQGGIFAVAVSEGDQVRGVAIVGRPVARRRLDTMKKLCDMRLLEGAVEEITMTQLRGQPGEVLDQVALGKTFIITRNGRPLAELRKMEPTALQLGAEARRLGLCR